MSKHIGPENPTDERQTSPNPSGRHMRVDESSLPSIDDPVDPPTTDAVPSVDDDATRLMPEHSGDAPASEPQWETLRAQPGEALSGLATDAAAEAQPHKRSRAPFVVAGLAGGLVAVYLGGVALFNNVYIPGTSIHGQDVSLKPLDEVTQARASEVSSWQTKVSGHGLDITINAGDIGMSFDANAYARATHEQLNPWAWPLEIAGAHDLQPDSGATYDEGALRTFLQTEVDRVNQTAQQPVDATVAYDQGAKKFAVVAEKGGTTVDLDRLVDFLKDDVSGMATDIELDDSVLAQPKVTKDDPKLKTAADNANKYLQADIPLTMAGQDAGKVTRDQISGWVTLNPEDLSATLDQGKMAEWAKTEIGQKLDTVGAQRTYTRPDGKQVTVSGGTYGWTTDEAQLVQALASQIQSGSNTAIEIPTKAKTAQVPDAGKKDWGNRYIDIDIAEQHVRMYDESGNVIWESDCVTGDSSQGNDTPMGVYAMNNYRASGNVELRGLPDSTGAPSYISHVDYWMPFIDNLVALHDADWRRSFGGSIYRGNGSHGCVNLPVGKAKELFDLCKIGDVVVVHG